MASIRCLGETHGDKFALYHGDCVDLVRQMPDNSIDLAVYSPLFSGLYLYNNSIADMGNSATDDEFFEHYRFLLTEMYRVMRPGRLCAVHCKDLVFYKTQRGTAGLRDFPGMIIRAHEDAEFNYHSRVTIWRCPVREMTKTKAHGLLYKQLRADSSFSRQGLPEYFVVFRKWADEDSSDVLPIEKTKHDYPLDWWQEAASPVWMNTRETDVLNAIRAPGDEKHICPMPLDLTRRATLLWSNPDDVVLSPFTGIGSEGYVALTAGRKFIGCELKKEYFEQAGRHLKEAERGAVDLFT